MAKSEGFPLTGREVILEAPLTEEKIRTLKVGDVVLIRGEMYTGRDAVHHISLKNFRRRSISVAASISRADRYVVLEDGGTPDRNQSGGASTSVREEPYRGR